MKQKLYLWIEDYLFFPNAFQQIIAYLLLPLTFIYMLIILTKRTFAKERDFGIPVISIGNIIVGGSGKTPVAIKLASSYEDVCVILRGYGRASKGLYVISNKGQILEDISVSGDEAMLLAKSLSKATIIVSEDRSKAILKAKELGCKIIFLDDGFSKYNIKKFNILLRPKDEPTNFYCLPSGGYREPKGLYAYADLELKEGRDFNRIITIRKNAKDNKEVSLDKKVLVLTAISKPKRLLEFLPKDTKLLAYPDHHTFIKEEIEEIKEKYKEYQILTTGKDLVKLENFNIKNLYLMHLDIKIEESVDFSLMREYIKSYE
ncbi:tetraacyldisaccharide 4'-kinase [Poseidonibacter ostreae]|uniref:Tetraacyldisaccharide 4'-kinase n=1 Tax=Poseidonibacter ostreae TaxID=2654171 RepID=A0A6L4WVN7_9BACT|nr:tetraacyldisaccharide 4'-kinase [Poseidonibacter ostreae]KAB7887327.1 tetraacyldisaccharide 4'-kinase [Poseidonibacter ostreae]KAB7890248.1 tetraacyldisaccharide 4'-kinase [Poseidonibacter ostreae]KAB7890828.1 tetraacyldisaccharide 4'-kinase [Poseidonibacter ostreae]MAC84175.1 tetraacyldisaccharide 4'-kinase [Arcobacter sp.]